MKQQTTTPDPAEKEGSSLGQPRPARRSSPGVEGSQYDLRVSYYATMKPQRVYPLVVEVLRGAAAADDRPTGVSVTLRPVVAGALVAPAELPLEVSRPGARATFQVTPVAKGRLPEACVRVLHDGRQVQELRTRMTAKTQRTTWVLLLLALILPPLVVHYVINEPLKGRVPVIRKAAPEEPKPTKPGEGDQQAGPPKMNLPAVPSPPPVKPPPDIPGRPGEILRARMTNAIRPLVPEFPYSDEVISGITVSAGAVYDVLCQWAEATYLPCWLAVGLLILAFGSWALHKPTRVRVQGSVALPRLAGAGARYAAETGETLPLARPQGDDLG